MASKLLKALNLAGWRGHDDDDKHWGWWGRKHWGWWGRRHGGWWGHRRWGWWGKH
ncbi:hypothetical protein ACVGVM_08395 [Pseudonocardia bannensis]